MVRNRYRIYFSKQGDLRLISHRDLVRTFERLFRRAQLRLSMSEGFHPKARMTFPSALGLGIEGRQEVMELELAEEVDAQELAARLAALAPPGLAIGLAQRLEQEHRKARLCAARYQIPVPDERHEQVQAAIQSLLAKRSCIVQRPGGQPVDLRADLEDLQLVDGQLHMRLTVSPSGNARAREVLEALGLGDLEEQGAYLTRVAVELAEQTKAENNK